MRFETDNIYLVELIRVDDDDIPGRTGEAVLWINNYWIRFRLSRSRLFVKYAFFKLNLVLRSSYSILEIFTNLDR